MSHAGKHLRNTDGQETAMWTELDLQLHLLEQGLHLDEAALQQLAEQHRVLAERLRIKRRQVQALRHKIVELKGKSHLVSTRAPTGEISIMPPKFTQN